MKKDLFFPTKVEYQADEKNANKGQIIIEPCWPGYGLTWGNALRRVLLTSLPGSAVTAVKIKGVKYEFTTVEGIKEDILEIILNLKSLYLKILNQGDEPIRLKLKASGEKKVFAKDIEKNPDVEIADPNLLIATLTDKKANLEMDIWAEKGYGWVPSEEKSREDLEIDTIVIDSIFTPVLNVSVNVENMRVGKKTDFDRIVLEMETNGTILPLEAFLQATNLLKEQFSAIINFLKETEEQKSKSKTKKSVVKKPKKISSKKTIKKSSKSSKTKKTVSTKKKSKKPVKKSKKK